MGVLIRALLQRRLDTEPALYIPSSDIPLDTPYGFSRKDLDEQQEAASPVILGIAEGSLS